MGELLSRALHKATLVYNASQSYTFSPAQIPGPTTMSAQVTVHRMTTTTTTTAILINVGYVKTLPGALKLLQMIVGVSIIGHFIHRNMSGDYDYMLPELFFLIALSACLFTTTLLFMASLWSIATASILPKTLFETMYHVTALLLCLSSGIWFLVIISKRDRRDYVHDQEPKLAAASLGVVNA